MKLLIITGPLWPRVWNNANLMSKLLPYLRQKHELQILSPAFKENETHLPKEMFGLPVSWVTDSHGGLKRKIIYPAASRFAEKRGYEGDLGARLIRDAAVKLQKRFAFDAIIYTMQPYVAMLAAAKLTDWPSIGYLMDPFDCLLDGQSGSLPKAIFKTDCVLTTPFIREALLKNGGALLDGKITEVSFPHVEALPVQRTPQDIAMPAEKINLLFCGALYPEIRSPDVFFRIVERLDDRFCIHFLGRGCPELFDHGPLETAAEIRVYPPLPYQTAINAMHDADILINIGNNMHVHMPSKTLDYINTGKPFVNFYKFTDCPTLYYTNRYQLCLNLYEKTFDPERDTAKFAEFCLSNRDHRVSREEIEERFSDCRPEMIADTILEQIEKLESR